MKNLLVLPLVLLTVCVFAEDRVLIGSFERLSSEIKEFDVERNRDGFGLKFLNFRDEGVYLGAGFAYLTGDMEGPCFLVGGCVSIELSETMFSVEIGRDLDQWPPFFAVSFSRLEVEILDNSTSDESWDLNAGVWFDLLDTLKLRGTVTNLDGNDDRTIFGGVLFQMDNNFVLGAEIGMLLDDEVNEFRFSLQIGRAF